MVEAKFTKTERALIDDAIAFYRSKVYPDYQLDKNDPDTILMAIDYAHGKGQVISPTSTSAHALMRSIERKCGREVEEPEECQKRLAKERYEKIHNIIIEAKKAEAAEAGEVYEEKKAEVKKLEAKLEQVKAEDAGVAKAVAEAQKKAFEAEQENARLRTELAKAKQTAKELANSKGAIEELAKGDEAKIVSVPEPKTEEEKALEEKSIEELIEEMKLEE